MAKLFAEEEEVGDFHFIKPKAMKAAVPKTGVLNHPEEAHDASLSWYRALKPGGLRRTRRKKLIRPGCGQ
jgi:hypothetical protein